ncbi:MAG: hypothetical protein AAB893_01275, partial [Patescibacteria group bacterium]
MFIIFLLTKSEDTNETISEEVTEISGEEGVNEITLGKTESEEKVIACVSEADCLENYNCNDGFCIKLSLDEAGSSGTYESSNSSSSSGGGGGGSGSSSSSSDGSSSSSDSSSTTSYTCVDADCGGYVCDNGSACYSSCESVGNGSECASGYYCSEDVCTAQVDVGGSCSDHGACVSGFCNQDVCSSTSSLGEPCISGEDVECAESYCSSGRECVECKEDSHCSGNFACESLVSGECFTDCTEDIACADGYSCESGVGCYQSTTELEGLCDFDVQCSSGYCSSTGSCVECASDTDCETLYDSSYTCGSDEMCAATGDEICFDYVDNDGDDTIDTTGGCDVDGDLEVDYICGCYVDGGFSAYGSDLSCTGSEEYGCLFLENMYFIEDSCGVGKQIEGIYYESDSDCITSTTSTCVDSDCAPYVCNADDTACIESCVDDTSCDSNSACVTESSASDYGECIT